MPAELSAPPNDVHIENIDSNQLVFSWSPVPVQCPLIQYVITSRNCGICPSITNATSVSCIHYNSVSPHENRTMSCMFAVQTEVCGSILGTSNAVGKYIIILLLYHHKTRKANTLL